MDKVYLLFNLIYVFSSVVEFTFLKKEIELDNTESTKMIRSVSMTLDITYMCLHCNVQIMNSCEITSQTMGEHVQANKFFLFVSVGS